MPGPDCFLRYAIVLALPGVFAAAVSRDFKIVLRPTACMGIDYWAPIAAVRHRNTFVGGKCAVLGAVLLYEVNN